MNSRGWRVAEAFLLIAGLALLDWYIWVRAGGVVRQAWESWLFRREVHETRVKLHRQPALAPPRLRKGDLVGRLEIPRLNLVVMVKEGSDADTLEGAAGHLPSSPVPGFPGNVAVAAHRDTFFRPLRNLRVHDLIRFSTLRGAFEYEVESLKIVRPADVSVLRASEENTLTLVTCYPFYYVGPAPERFIVRARQVAAPPLVERASLQR